MSNTNTQSSPISQVRQQRPRKALAYSEAQPRLEFWALLLSDSGLAWSKRPHRLRGLSPNPRPCSHHPCHWQVHAAATPSYWLCPLPGVLFLLLAIVNKQEDGGMGGSKKVKVAQSCPTLCDPDYMAHGILQARILERVTFPSFRGSSQPRDGTQVSCIAGGFFTS